MSSQPGLHFNAAGDHGPHAPARLRRPPMPRRLRPAYGGSRRHLVERPRLVAPLVDGSRPLAVIVAPAGYGKSMLLADWRAWDPRPFACLALSAAHDDPARLLTSITAALLEIQPLLADVAAPAATFDDLSQALAALRPSVLALDGVDALRSDAAQAAVARLVADVPLGTTVALVSRRDPALPLGRLRAQDDVTELRTNQLAMTRSEAAELLRQAGLALTEAQADRLFELTSGWPAALQLAVRAVRDQGDTEAALDAFGGDDTIVGEYVREEVLSALDPDDRAFLRRTSVIGRRLGGAVCDAALDRNGSGSTLRKLARANVPLIPLDRGDVEYRLHPLLGQALRTELLRTEPALAAQLQRRASEWYEHEGDVELAIECAVAALDLERVCELLADRSMAFVASGRAALVDGWLRRLGDESVASHASLAIAAAVSRLARGDRDAAERWAAVAVERAAATRADATVAVEVSAALVRASAGRQGVEQMVHEAHSAYAATPQHGPWRSLACLIEGSGLILSGRIQAAAAILDEGARCAIFDAPLIRSVCLAELAFLALQSGDLDDADVLVAGALAAVERDARGEYPLAALTFAVSALAHAHRGRLDAAREDLEDASHRLAVLPDAAPWYGAMTRVVMARVQLKLSDACEGRHLLSEASRLRRQADGALALQAWIDEGWALADDYAAGPVACPSTLTMAELRILRLLPSHLTFREIAARLHVSANTVKSQAHAVYRKLDARSRSEAVANAAALGLVDARITRSG